MTTCELPVLLQAMGAEGVAFSRIPGSCLQGSNGVDSMFDILLDNEDQDGGVTFLWSAGDGSQVAAHLLQDQHQAQGIAKPSEFVYGSPAENKKCYPETVATNPVEHIIAYRRALEPVSPSPYLYVEVSDDFAWPQFLVNDAADYVIQYYNKTGIWVTVGTFDHYMRATLAYAAANNNPLKQRSWSGKGRASIFRGTPYWMGYYVSRPALKILHSEAVRNLLRAEMLSTILQATKTYDTQYQKLIDDVWEELVPSTHHDYITGTATDYVYQGEQLPLAWQCLNNSQHLISSFLDELVSVVTIEGNKNALTKSPHLVVLNSVSVNNVAVVEVEGTQWPGYDTDYYQISGDNTTSLFVVSAPSMGYSVHNQTTTQELWEQFIQQIGSRKTEENSEESPRQIAPPQEIVLENSMIRVAINKENGNLAEIFDQDRKENILGGPGNIVDIYYDGGDIYRFGFEEQSCVFCKLNLESKLKNITITETGPLRQRVVVDMLYTFNGRACKNRGDINPVLNMPLQFQYTLYINEPFVRVAVTGVAPRFTTVMINLPFHKELTSFDHGTPYHWTTKFPQSYGTWFSDQSTFNQTFEPVHDFLLLNNREKILGAIYHKGNAMAWSVSQGMATLAALRNTPGMHCAGKGADGTDNGEHTIEYAVRVPTNLTPANTGAPLLEARKYSTPMIAVMTDKYNSEGRIPSSFSVASSPVKNRDNNGGIITSVKLASRKEGTLIRYYNPSNQLQKASVIVPKLIWGESVLPRKPSYVTALEDPLSNSTLRGEIKVTVTTGSGADAGVHLKFEAETAVTTVLIPP